MAVIRHAEKDDYNEIYRLELYLNNYCANINPGLFEIKSEINEDDKTDKGNCFVIKHENQIIGFFDAYVMSTMDEDGSISNCRFIVETFVVEEKYQNMKFGKKLFSFLEEHARRRGCEKIVLKTLNEERMVKFYQRMGMSIDYFNLGKKIEPINKMREYRRCQWEKEYQVI
ncbi:MAG: GNAT family N-acetyltransferase [Treponema sp.]|nr:GNAT family N-acetyltransferase [Treponema sp.]